MMDGRGESDRPVVPTKSPNNAAQAAAEGMEGRGLAKENTSQQNASRTQSRIKRAECAGPCATSSKERQGGEVHGALRPRRGRLCLLLGRLGLRPPFVLRRRSSRQRHLCSQQVVRRSDVPARHVTGTPVLASLKRPSQSSPNVFFDPKLRRGFGHPSLRALDGGAYSAGAWGDSMRGACPWPS